MPNQHGNRTRRYVTLYQWVCCNCGLNHSMETPWCTNPNCQHAYNEHCCRKVKIYQWVCCNCGLNHSMQTPQCTNPNCQHAYNKRCCRKEPITVRVRVEPTGGSGSKK